MMRHNAFMVAVLMVLALVLLVMALPIGHAHADPVSLTPLYEQVINQVLATVLEGVALGVSGWVMFLFHKYLTPLLGAQLEAKARDSVNTALANGMAIAMHKVEGAEAAHATVEVKGAMAAWAAQYAIDHAPGAIAKFGLDPNQLALKALAYIPPAPTTVDVAATAVVVPVKVEPLADAKPG